MKPIKIDGVRVGGVGGYALIFTGVRDKLIVLVIITGFLLPIKIQLKKK